MTHKEQVLRPTSPTPAVTRCKPRTLGEGTLFSTASDLIFNRPGGRTVYEARRRSAPGKYTIMREGRPVSTRMDRGMRPAVAFTECAIQ
jgi:hypothetical protein